jgi:hypothetical protein
MNIFRCSIFVNIHNYSLRIKNEVSCFPYVNSDIKRIKTVEDLCIELNKMVKNLPTK